MQPLPHSMHVPNPSIQELDQAAMGGGQSRARESYNLDPGWRRRESKDQPMHVKRTEARNVMFGVFELTRYPLALKRTPRDPVPCAPEYCEQLIEYVQSDNASSVEFHLRDSPPSSVDHIMSYYSAEGLTVLHYATRQESTDILKKLVEFCKEGEEGIINVKSEDSHEFTPLHIAARSENVECVRILTDHPHIQLDAQDAEGLTPLHHACFHGFADIVLALRDADFCIANTEGDFPLHIAASEYKTSVFTALKQDQVFNDKCKTSTKFKCQQDSDGNTLLHIAVDSEESEVVDWCLELGFDLRATNKLGMNSLHVAARRGCVKIAQKLVEKEQELGNTVKEFIDLGNNYQATPLYLASKFNQSEMVKFLLEQGANIESTSSFGFTPLLVAIRYTNPCCVKELLARNANILTKDSKRSLNALLWAVELQNLEVLRHIIERASQSPDVARSIYRERDSDRNTAHHLAARARNLNMLETLVQYNTTCLEERNREGCTPFHIAVKEGKLAIVSYILSNSAGSTHAMDGSDNTGLHLAAERGHTAIVERLVTVHNTGASFCSRNINGWTPIHLAAKNGHHMVLEFLLDHSPKNAWEILDNDHATALYLACQWGHPKCVEILLAWGAMVTYTYSSHGVKLKKSGCEVAIDKDHFSVVSTLTQSNVWEQALQYCSDPKAKDGETPVRKLIKKMPAAAKLVFDRCITKKRFEDWKRGGYYFKMHYNYEFLEDFQDLFEDQGPKFTQGPGIQSTVFQNQDTAAGEIIANEPVLMQDPPPSSLSLSLSVSHPSHPTRADHVAPFHFQHHEPTAHQCDLYRSWGPVKYNYRNHPLHLMVYHKRQDLLKHPLVASFIHFKWNLFGKYVYYPNIIIYTLLMLMLTIYMFLQFDYSRELELATNRSSLSDCFDLESRNKTLDFLKQTAPDVAEPLLHKKKQLIAIAVLIIINCMVRIVGEVAQLIHHRGEFFVSYINYLEGFLYIATIIFVTNFELNCLPSWRWQVGALCIFLSWLNFTLFLSQQPTVGIYVVMFQEIIKTFLRMGPMTVLLILAFGQPFFMLLSTVETNQPPQQFVTFPYSLLKTITMTIGEIETDPLFFSTPSLIQYPVVTYLLWIVFLIVMPVLLQNMLVGLAVDDIKGVQEKAALKKEALQIEFVLDVMNRLPKPLVRWRNSRQYTQTWARGPLDKFRKWFTGSSWKPEVRDNKLQYNMFQRLESMAQGMTALEHRMGTLIEQTAKLEKMMLHFAHEQERYLEPARQHLLTKRRVEGPSQHTLNVLEEHESLQEVGGGEEGEEEVVLDESVEQHV